MKQENIIKTTARDALVFPLVSVGCAAINPWGHNNIVRVNSGWIGWQVEEECLPWFGHENLKGNTGLMEIPARRAVSDAPNNPWDQISHFVIYGFVDGAGINPFTDADFDILTREYSDAYLIASQRLLELAITAPFLPFSDVTAVTAASFTIVSREINIKVWRHVEGRQMPSIVKLEPNLDSETTRLVPKNGAAGANLSEYPRALLILGFAQLVKEYKRLHRSDHNKHQSEDSKP